MATRWAVANGNWSNTATWDGGTLPAAGDDVYADGRTVTVDQDINVGSLHTDARSGGTAGGGFTVSCASGQTRTITCTGTEPNVVAGPSHCITISSPPADATVRTYCSPKGGTSSLVYGIYKTSACTYQHEGNCYTGSVTRTPGLFIYGGTSNAVQGDAYGTTGGSWQADANGAVSVSGSGVTATMTGNAYGGASFGVHVLSSAQLTLTGNIYSQGSQPGAYLYGSAQLTVNGNIYAQGSQPGAYLYSSSKLTVNGNIYGHATNSAVAGCSAYDSTNLLILNGDAIAQAGPAISGNGLRVRVNGNLQPSTSNYAITNCALELNGTAYIASNGRPGFGALTVFGLNSSFDDGIKVRYYDAQTNTLGSEDTLSTSTVYGNLYPAESNVRHGVQYGPSSQFTGTAYIPDPGSVAKGVPVDNTVGNAVLTSSGVSAAVWDELRSGHTTTGTYGAVSEWAGGGGGGATPADIWSYASRTLTAATNITSNGAPIDQSKITNLDATVSSRLAASSYVAPDNTSIGAIKTKTDKLQFDASNRIIADAQAISASTTAADAVEANIGNLDASVSSRAPASTALSNAIWTDAKAGFLDAAVSSRLSSSDISTIVTNVFSNTIETGITFKNLCQILGSVIAGEISTAGTGTEVFKAINNDAVTRVSVTVDQTGNRSNVVFTL